MAVTDIAVLRNSSRIKQLVKWSMLVTDASKYSNISVKATPMWLPCSTLKVKKDNTEYKLERLDF